VIVTLRDQVDGADYAGRPQALMAALRASARASQPDVIDEIDGRVRRFWIVNAVAARVTPDEARVLAADPEVETVDLDVPVQITQEDANSPFPDAGTGNWGLEVVNAPAVWRDLAINGAGVRVGSIDTGVDASNPDLAGKVVAWRDFVSGRPEPYDDNGHGTHTIGTMVGGDRGGAAVGVAPGATVVVAKAIGANGVGPGSALLAAAQWMTDPDGNPATADQPVVVNNSWSAENPNDPWFRTLIRRWLELGIVPVFAAGNSGPGAGTIGSPAGYPEALAVGAVNPNNSLANFSSQGPVTWENLDGLGPAAGTVLTKPDVVAPGVAITSTVGSGYLAFSGTSMAAPHVAGIVALMTQANPSLRGQAAADVVRQTAADLGAAGADSRFGMGRVDALAAVRAAMAPIPDTRFVGAPPAATQEITLRFQVAISNAVTYRWRLNGGEWSAPTLDPVFQVDVAEGRHVIEAQSIAVDGSVDTTPVVRRVIVDRTPPRVTFKIRDRRDHTEFVARVRDALTKAKPGSYRWSFGDGRTGVGKQARHRFTTTGVRRIRLTARDEAGNTAVVTRFVRVVDATGRF
jgi:subtilisin family serine protease